MKSWNEIRKAATAFSKRWKNVYDEKAAQEVLDVRAHYPDQTLAALYDPLFMPPDLVKAHAHLDALVDKAYGLKTTATDSDRVALLFKLYAEKMKEA